MPCDMSKYTRAFIRGKNKVAQNEIQKKTCGFSYSKYMANLEAFHWVISSSINLLFLRVEKIHSNLSFVRKSYHSTSVSKFQWQVCSNKLQTSQEVGGKKNSEQLYFMNMNNRGKKNLHLDLKKRQEDIALILPWIWLRQLVR